MLNWTDEKRINKINDLDFSCEYDDSKQVSLKDDYIDCNTINVDLDTPIYKIVSWKRLKDILTSSSLSLSKPKTWPDPYETFLLNSKAKMKDGSIVSFQNLRDKIYCSCWSLRKECEGLWNTHAGDDSHEFIKMKSTPRKVMKYLYDINNTFHYLSYFCGKVLYVEEEEINQILSESIGQYFTSMGYMSVINSLLIKRLPFDYEEEVRFIFNTPNGDLDISKLTNQWDLSKDYFTFKININEVVDELVFHPYISKERMNQIESEIKSLGFLNSIKKSNLFSKEYLLLNF